MGITLPLNGAILEDQTQLFQLLYEKINIGRIVLLFDEISWMGSRDPNFLGQIKQAWDQKFKKNNELIFIVCGSASAWIEDNILSNTGFLGRISYTLTLDELPMRDCTQFWRGQLNNISPYEKFKLLSVTGGVPQYLEELNPRLTAEENILQLCFNRGGILAEEFEHIFANVFQRNTSFYREIVRSLIEGPKQTIEISQACNTKITGLLSQYLEELSLCGFITRDYTWSIKTGQDSRLSHYRLSDNYLRFYLRYIERYKTKINRGSYEFTTLAALPEWRVMLGLQFENMVLNNRRYIQHKLKISSENIISDNPFFQRSTKTQQGCQIDYMIQTKFNTLYVCEIKFSKNPIGSSVIAEVQEKIKRLKRPKGFSCRPVLVHVKGITEDLKERNYFSNIIDFAELLI